MRPSARSKLATGVAIAVCGLLGMAGTAAAAAKTVVRPAGFEFEAQLPETDGYAVYLRADDHRHVRLEIESENEGEGSAPLTTLDYSTVGQVRRHGIDVDFGQFGHIDLHFVGKPKRNRYPFPNCAGKKVAVQEYAAMAGSIDFEALGGVVKLTGNRVAEAHTWESPKRTCTPKQRVVYHGGSGTTVETRPRSARREPEFSPLTTLLARARTTGRLIDLYAFDLEGEVIDAAATSTRRFGGVLVETTVHAPDEEEPGGPPDLSISGGDPRPTGARLSMGSPFSGSATFAKEPGSAPTWTGSLTTEIPGEGTLPLAGADFHAILCAYESTKKQRACERTVAPPHVD